MSFFGGLNGDGFWPGMDDDGWSQPSFSSDPNHYHVPLTRFLHDFVTVHGTEKAQLYQGKHPQTGDTVQLWVPRSLLRGAKVWKGFTPTYLPAPLGLQTIDGQKTKLGTIEP